jgi:hypothetical protein
MLFGPGMFLAAGATIGVALLDKVCEELGFNWLGTVIKLILPIVGFALAIYFLETNTMLRWLK